MPTQTHQGVVQSLKTADTLTLLKKNALDLLSVLERTQICYSLRQKVVHFGLVSDSDKSAHSIPLISKELCLREVIHC
jgi:hypothetical protein